MRPISLKSNHLFNRKRQDSSKEHPRTLNKPLIDKIMSLRDETGNRFYQKFSTESILINIEKHQIQIVELFSKYMKEGFNLLQFVRFFLNIIPHYQIENLYLAIGLVDLFREITLETHKERVVLKDITDFMCEKMVRQERNFNKIEAKFVPFTKFFKPNQEAKEFLQVPPTIYGQTDEKIYKLSPKTIKTDSSKHSRAIVKSEFCRDLKKVFILDALSESISVFDEDCSLNKKISPSLSKLKKDVIILSFAFSKRQFRIGAVLKDFSLKFWDHFNNFDYQKSISTTSICQNLQTNIYFLQYFNIWITTDRTGTIHCWNLLEERPDRTMKCKYAAPVNGVCQISSLNLLVVVQECKRNCKLLVEQPEKGEPRGSQATVVLYNYYNGQIITEIDLQGMRIPHTLIYSETYQVLFMSGLQKKIKVYDLHPVYMDAGLKGELIGHENLITCFALIDSTPMLVSADDKGKVKLWDFRNFMCLQTIDFSDKTIITNLLDMIDIGKIGVFGSRVNYIQFEDRYNLIKKRVEQEPLKIEAIDFDPYQMEMFVFANKTLRVIDLQKGQVKYMLTFQHGHSEEQYTTFRYFANQKKIVLGSSNGQISIYSGQTGQVETTLRSSHEGAVNFIQYDDFNKLFISTGYDSRILIHRAADNCMIREIKNNFGGKEINCLEVSVYHNIIIMGSHTSPIVYVWNYQFCKIMGEIRLPDEEYPLCLHMVNGFGLMVLGTNKGNIHLFKTIISSTDIDASHLATIPLGKPILTAYSDLKLEGRGKATSCQRCKLLVACEAGDMMEFDLTHHLQKQDFKFHSREKSSYNPYRQTKQNFISEIQKQKHSISTLDNRLQNKASEQFRCGEIIATNLGLANICKMLKMQQSYHVMVGNDRRIKVWNCQHQLLCDLNINYCLPYQWKLNPTSRTVITQKIYYGIRVLQTISNKYSNDISIGQAKNLEVRDLLQMIQHSNKGQNSSLKMITEPEEISKNIKQSQGKGVTLLQNQYSRKDLNFQLVKRFNFTEVAGPTLKELDNIKKIDNLQKEWRLKEGKQERQKGCLLKNIESKAKKNQQKQQIQMLFVKHKKTSPKEQKEQNDKILSLTKKLNSLENKVPEQKKTFTNTLYRKTFKKLVPRLDQVLSMINFYQPKQEKGSSCESKVSFEGYFRQRYRGEVKKEEKIGFRQILTEMNGRVNSLKKYRYRKGKGSKTSLTQVSFKNQ